jgi:hypothetical protein
MLDRAIIRLAAIAVALVGPHPVRDPSPARAQEADAPVTRAVPSVDAQATAIVDAANAFLATLSNQQKAAVLFDFKDSEQRVRWSNLPAGIVRRAGMAWGDMHEGAAGMGKFDPSETFQTEASSRALPPSIR